MSLNWAYRFFVLCIISGIVTGLLAIATLLNWGVHSFSEAGSPFSNAGRSEQAVALASESVRSTTTTDAQGYLSNIENAEDATDVLTQLRSYANTQGLVIETRIPQKYDGLVSGAETAEDSTEGIRNFSRVLVEEISKYPDDFLRKNGVKTILLLERPEISDDRGEYGFGGLAIAEDNLMVLDYMDGQTGIFGNSRYVDYVDSEGCASSDINIRKGIHHEIWHLLDEHNLHYADAGWSNLNDAGFNYSQPQTFAGFEVDYHNCGIVAGSDFTTPYAQIDALEDRADTYAYMMTEELYVRNKRLMQAEGGNLRKKVAFIKRHLQKMDSRLGAQYFEQLHRQ